MKSVSVTEFKAHCLELLNEVSRTGHPLLLTKRGKATVMVSRPPEEVSSKWVPGQFKDRAKIVGDVIAPIDEPWEAAS